MPAAGTQALLTAVNILQQQLNKWIDESSHLTSVGSSGDRGLTTLKNYVKTFQPEELPFGISSDLELPPLFQPHSSLFDDLLPVVKPTEVSTGKMKNRQRKLGPENDAESAIKKPLNDLDCIIVEVEQLTEKKTAQQQTRREAKRSEEGRRDEHLRKKVRLPKT